ncbi:MULTISPECIES: BsuPI-related putative proteinase inhibitor [unclassified Paenibacillus]|uniref:BsuPI-related putative proteinase inhibitor n=1 Tax=unclassified Paenibacillus TaxID=185978 RepID=UPI0024065E75|nr:MULTISPECIES: BsuPI-related putative proteinase inhibitor [unclassified Paenibacillus]
MQIGLQNVSGKDLWIGQSSHKYEIVITDANNKVVKNFSENKIHTQELVEREFKNSDNIYFNETWDYKNSQDAIYYIQVKFILYDVSEKTLITSEELTANTTIEL